MTSPPPSQISESTGADKVYVWWLDLDTVTGDHWPVFEGLLETDERERAQRFHFPHDRQSYIAAHAVARALLSRWTGLDPSAWRFTIGEFGKPEVISPPDFPGLRINLSHTRGMVAAVLTQHHDIGVDVEWLGRKCDIERLSPEVFTAEEQAILHNTPDDKKQDVFLTLWTLKEAYIKAIGKGLSQPLSDFHFSLDPLAIHFTKAPPAASTKWWFRHFRPTETHTLGLGLATEHSAPEITIETAPLDWIAGLTPL